MFTSKQGYDDARALAQPKKSQDGENNDDGADDIDNAVHESISFVWIK
jgi:hypothetical protein